MLYSCKCSYAIQSLTRLAMIRPQGFLLIEDLCSQTDLPRHFVAKILQELVRQKLLISAKGRGGGFALSRSPSEIRLLDIVTAVDGIQGYSQCAIGHGACDEHQPCPLHDHWKDVRQQIESFLTRTTLADMSDTLGRKLELLGQPIPQPRSESKNISAR